MIDERPTWHGDSEDPGDAWAREPWVRELDLMVRPVLVTTPPADVQASILAAVLLATAPPQPVAVPVAVSAENGRSIPLAAYVMLAGVLVAYVAGVSWLEGFFGNVTWVSILVQQLVAAVEQTVGRPANAEPMALAWELFLRAPWIALLPVAWLLWDRDRTSTPAV